MFKTGKKFLKKEKLFFIAKNNIFLSTVIIIAFVSNFTSQTAPYLGDLSPYHSAAIEFEDNVFLRLADERLRDQLDYEKDINVRIMEIASNFHTGLDPKYLDQISRWIVEESKKYGYDPLFLTALIITESSFYNWAKSRQGALGLMQIRPETGYAMATEVRVQWQGKKTLYDPGTNIALGAYYLNKLLKRYGDMSLALEAYNHGPTQLNRYLRRGVRPKVYSKKVFKNYKRIRSASI